MAGGGYLPLATFTLVNSCPLVPDPRQADAHLAAPASRLGQNRRGMKPRTWDFQRHPDAPPVRATENSSVSHHSCNFVASFFL